MAGRQTDVRVSYSGEDRGLERVQKSAAASARVFIRELERQERQAQRTREELAQLGTGAAAFGAALAAGLGLATRAAIQWESAFTGVRKTVEASEAQYARISDGLRQLAMETTTSAVEIAAVAEAAGQLGVEADSVVSFTRTMVQLGDTTDLSATEAATAIARLHNVMGVLNSEAARTGSVIVALGNNFATTESEILSMSTRIAGAGRVVGLSVDEVLSLSAALSSVGISAELGGTNVSKALSIIAGSVQAGGRELEAFADVAGVSAEEFAGMWRSAPAEALAVFVEGLNATQAAGGNVFQTLNDLGLTGSEMQRVMLGLAGASEQLNSALEMGSEAWDENTALLAEAQQRYQTTEARITQARAAINDAGISLGQVFSPAVSEAAQVITYLAQTASGLPPTAQAVGGGLLAITAAASTLGGGILVLLPRVAELQATLRGLGPRGAAAAGAISRVGSVLAGPWGVAMAGAVTLLGLFIAEKAKQKAAVDAARAAIEADSGAIAENTRAYAAEQLVQRDLVEVIDELGLSHRTALDAALGNADALAQVRARVEEIRSETGGANRSLALDLFGDDAFQVATSFRIGIEEVAGSIAEAEEQARQFGLTNESASDATVRQAEAMGLMSGAAGDAEQAMTDLDDAITALLDTVFAMESAEDAFQASLLDVEEATYAVADAQAELGERRTSGDATTRELRESEIALERATLGVNDALRRSAEEAANVARELINTEGFTESTASAIEDMARQLETQAIAAGRSEEEARELGNSIRRIPREAETAFIMNGLESAVRDVTDLRNIVESVPGRRTIYFNVIRQGDAPARGFVQVAQAEGSILHHAQSGLMLPRNQATIAPANSSVLFAETPATGPEAYIPLGSAYRSRSLAIWEQAGRELGARGGMSVTVQTDGTEAARRIAGEVVTRTAEAAALGQSWGSPL